MIMREAESSLTEDVYKRQSMGGLMSLYAITAYNKVFSKAACLSPSVRLCMPELRQA